MKRRSVIGSTILVEVGAEVVDRLLEPLAQRHLRRPTERLADQCVVGIVITDVDSFAVGGKFLLHKLAAAVNVDEQLRQVGEADDLGAAKIEDPSASLRMQGCPQQG